VRNSTLERCGSSTQLPLSGLLDGVVVGELKWFMACRSVVGGHIAVVWFVYVYVQDDRRTRDVT
jgi:hypothetical protein